MPDTTNYVPIAPAMDVHGAVSIARMEADIAAHDAQAREDMMDAALFVAAAIVLAAVLYYVRPLYHRARKSAGRFRAWLNAYGA